MCRVGPGCGRPACDPSPHGDLDPDHRQPVPFPSADPEVTAAMVKSSRTPWLGTGWDQFGEVLGVGGACVQLLLLARTSPLLTHPCLGFKAPSSLSACGGRPTSLEWPWSSWLQVFLWPFVPFHVGRGVLSFLLDLGTAHGFVVLLSFAVC